MIPESFLGRVVATVIGFVSVGAMIHALMGEPPLTEMEGGAGAVAANLGSSFADMVQGATPQETPDAPIEPDQPDPVEETDPPEETPPEEVTETEPEPLDPPENPVETAETPRDIPDEAQAEPLEAPEEPIETAETPREVPLEETDAEPVENAVVVETEQMQVDEAITALSVAPEPEIIDQVEILEPQVTQPLETIEPEVLEAEETETSAVTRSLRPQRRSAEFEEKNKPEPVRQQVRQTTQRTQAGNSQRTATAGVATAQQSTTRATNSGAGRSQAQGNAAASNYPGLVMRRLSRVSRPRVSARGAAVVAFTVASSGGLAGVSLARSSGSSELDQAAVRVVRRAAPFPPPPPGAQRSFSITIQGR